MVNKHSSNQDDLLSSAEEIEAALRRETQILRKLDARYKKLQEHAKEGGEETCQERDKAQNEWEAAQGRLRQQIRQAEGIHRRLERGYQQVHINVEALQESKKRGVYGKGEPIAQEGLRALERDASRYDQSRKSLWHALDDARKALGESGYIYVPSVPPVVWNLFNRWMDLVVPSFFSWQLGPLGISLGMTGLSIGIPLFEIGGWALSCGLSFGPTVDAEIEADWGPDVSPAEPIFPPFVLF